MSARGAVAGRPDIHETSRLLAGRIEELVLALTGAQPSIKKRDTWRWGTRGSLAVSIAGDKRGNFFDFESGEGGDAIDLVCHLRHVRRVEAWQWGLDWLGRAPTLPPTVAPTSRSGSRAPFGGDLWAAIWKAGAAASSSPAECYLASRGLALPPAAPLRFHPACPRGEDQLPAMLALMVDPITGRPCGVHRTFLRPDGNGKAEVTPAKMVLGNSGVIRLSDEVTGGLGIAEGIETALAIIQRMGWSPVWAVGSAGALAKFPVLPGVEALTIFADHDEIKPNGKQPGMDAADECARRWYAAGREATVQQPPIGEDWLDALGRAD